MPSTSAKTVSKTSDFLAQLEQLPGSYAGPTRPETAPYAVIGAGEGTLAAALFRPLVNDNLTRTGTQFVLSSADAADLGRTYSELAEVAGAGVRRVSTGGSASEVDVLVPGGVMATYHYAQYLAYATGHAAEAQQADELMRHFAQTCAPHQEQGNPARDLAWSLWERVPLLLAGADAEALPAAWQMALARVGKSLSIPVLGDPLAFVTGAFEARHEQGDGRLVLLLGDSDAALTVASEVLESRTDEIIHVPYPTGAESGYAAHLALWYFGLWVAAYLAERYQQTPTDAPILARAQAVLAGEEGEDTLKAERPERRDDVMRSGADWQAGSDWEEADDNDSDLDDDGDLDTDYEE